MIDFRFALDLNRLRDVELGEPYQWEGVLYSRFAGSFSVNGDRGQTFSIERPGVLWIARSLHYLLTFPAMQRANAAAHIPDTSIDLASHMDGGDIVLEVIDRPSNVTRFSGPLLQTLENFGRAYRQLFVDLATARPDIANTSGSCFFCRTGSCCRGRFSTGPEAPST